MINQHILTSFSKTNHGVSNLNSKLDSSPHNCDSSPHKLLLAKRNASGFDESCQENIENYLICWKSNS